MPLVASDGKEVTEMAVILVLWDLVQVFPNLSLCHNWTWRRCDCLATKPCQGWDLAAASCGLNPSAWAGGCASVLECHCWCPQNRSLLSHFQISLSKLCTNRCRNRLNRHTQSSTLLLNEGNEQPKSWPASRLGLLLHNQHVSSCTAAEWAFFFLSLFFFLEKEMKPWFVDEQFSAAAVGQWFVVWLAWFSDLCAGR